MSGQLPLGKLPPRTIGRWIIIPQTIASEENCPPVWFPPPLLPRTIASGQLPPRIITPEENYPQTIVPEDHCHGKIAPSITAPWMITPRLLFPGNYPKDNIVFQMICRLHNYPTDKCPRGKLPLRKSVSRINYTQYIFSTRIRDLNCFLLFSFFVV